MVPLYSIAPRLPKKGRLLGCPDAFRGHLDPKASRQAQDCPHNCSILRVGFQFAHERAINFDYVDRVSLQMRRRRIPGSEINQRNRHASPAQLLEHPLSIVTAAELDRRSVDGQTSRIEPSIGPATHILEHPKAYAFADRAAMPAPASSGLLVGFHLSPSEHLLGREQPVHGCRKTSIHSHLYQDLDNFLAGQADVQARLRMHLHLWGRVAQCGQGRAAPSVGKRTIPRKSYSGRAAQAQPIKIATVERRRFACAVSASLSRISPG
jgi:hypothetical protein